MQHWRHMSNSVTLRPRSCTWLPCHHFKLGASGYIPGLEDRYYFGRRPNGIYVMRFRNVDDRSRHPDFVRGYGYQGGASREGWGRGVNEPGIGVARGSSVFGPHTATSAPSVRSP